MGLRNTHPNPHLTTPPPHLPQHHPSATPPAIARSLQPHKNCHPERNSPRTLQATESKDLRLLLHLHLLQGTPRLQPWVSHAAPQAHPLCRRPASPLLLLLLPVFPNPTSNPSSSAQPKNPETLYPPLPPTPFHPPRLRLCRCLALNPPSPLPYPP